MARYDKYDPISGGFRGRLGEDHGITADSNGEAGPVGVGLNSDGRVVLGAGDTGIIGVVVKNLPRQPGVRFGNSLYGDPLATAYMGLGEGDVVDIMTSGEIVEVDSELLPGTRVYAAPDGSLTADADDGGEPAVANTPIGYIVDSGRLVVRVSA